MRSVRHPSVLVEVCTGERRADAATFYTRVGYRPPIAPTDVLVVAREARGIVAAVRLCDEHGWLVLRGMHVDPDRQRCGIGSELLVACVGLLGDRECLGLPFAHLQSFYERAGFRVLPDAEVPEILAGRMHRYRAKGEDVICMRRDPARHSGSREGLGRRW